MTFRDSEQISLWSEQNPSALPSSTRSNQDPEEQWLLLFHEHMLLTVQAIHRLHQAMSNRMLGPVQQ
jgi:hypothetical protein